MHCRGSLARYRAADEAFHILRSQHFIVDRELQLRSHRDKLKPDIIWNTERGLARRRPTSRAPTASAPPSIAG